MISGSPIARQLRHGMLLIVVLLGAAAAAAAAGALHQYRAVDQLTGEVQPVQRANVEAREDFASTQAGISGYLLGRRAYYLRFYRTQHRQFGYWITRLGRLGGRAIAGNLRTQEAAAAAWYRLTDRTFGLPEGDPAIGRLIDAAVPSSTAFYTANESLGERLDVRSRALTSESRRALATGLAWGGVLLFLTIGLAVTASVRTIRGITGPLSSLSATLRRLAVGDHAARAEVSGPAEVREVARSVNTLADESERLRRVEQEHAKLRAVARDAGNRIREHLLPEDVIRAAHTAIEQELDCDFVLVQLIRDGQLGSPESYRRDSPLPPGFLTELPEHAMDWLMKLYNRSASMVIQDLRGPEGDAVPAVIREPMLRVGIVSHLATPFGIGSEVLGLLAGERTRAGHPWTAAEIDAFQSIAADVGRGLNHARRYEAENRLVEDLKSLDRAKTDFLATVSHELRTPLTSISGYVELLRDREAGPVTPGQDLMLETIHRNAALLRNLIENVLTISKIDLGVSKTETRPVKLSEVVCAAVTAMDPVAEAGGVTLESDSAAEPLMVSGDTSQLDRVLMNLLSNAVKFTPKGGKVRVTATKDDIEAVVRVSDTGIGIPDKDKKDLFTRFFRASNVVMRAVPGTGLGLSVSHTIVADHGGELTVQSREGVGTTVTVRLPLLDPHAAACQEAVHSERS